MHNTSYNILVIDDEKSIRRLLEKELRSSKRRIILAASGNEGLQIAKNNTIDVIIMDLRLPDVTHLELLSAMKEQVPYSQIIMITGHGDVHTAVNAMKYGACDFIEKPFNLDNLDILIEKAHQRAELAREKQQASSFPKNIPFIGESKAIQDIKYIIQKVARAEISVLITGESGVGKDVIANLIHYNSPRSEEKIIIKNCATIQRDLARSELFGHAKGAFTGAESQHEGLLQHAHKSTLFLDEIGELPLAVQASLLRVLETKRYRKIGDKQEQQVNVRFIFATNRPLINEEKDGRFNEAFRHRINAFTIHVPPLRERIEDLPLLIDFFLARFSQKNTPYTLDEHVVNILLNYHWPGNIRELRNVIERAIILAENNLITKRCLPPELLGKSHDDISYQLSLEAVEQDHILKILHFYKGNRQKTADVLGISRKTLYRKLNKFDAR